LGSQDNWQEHLTMCFFLNSWWGNLNDVDGWLGLSSNVGKVCEVKQTNFESAIMKVKQKITHASLNIFCIYISLIIENVYKNSIIN